MTSDPSNADPDFVSPPRAWQRMLSGRRLDLLNPDTADIAIEDIAHGLARVARWNGQTVGEHAFSVAQHSLVVEEVVGVLRPDWSSPWRLAALLHDAPEYVIGDLISPFKSAIGLDYRAFEHRLLAAIHRRFAIPHPLPDEVSAMIKSADRIAAHYEATRLAGFEMVEAVQYFGPVLPIGHALTVKLARLAAESPSEMQQAFLERFRQLGGV